MPEKETLERADEDKREGKSPSTQAGEFVREEIHHIREGKHGAKSAKQAIAIGLSKARRAGVDLAPPAKGSVAEKTRKSAARDSRRGHSRKKKTVSASRSRRSEAALKREPRSAASHKALSRQAKSAARTRKKSAAGTTQSRRTQSRLALHSIYEEASWREAGSNSLDRSVASGIWHPRLLQLCPVSGRRTVLPQLAVITFCLRGITGHLRGRGSAIKIVKAIRRHS
jgi:hypothetical protein